jgi:PAT family beta-lactamase induction signal transducer AmpG
MAERDQLKVTGSWLTALAALVHPRAVTMLFLGFSAGIPILLIFSTLSVWLREAGVERATVTFFSWAALGYSFKFVWAPLIDRLPLPDLIYRLGRRRSWLLVSQFAIVIAIFWTSSFDPETTVVMTAVGAVLIGFSSATQDIVIDAYRIESAKKEMQSMLSAMYIAGYRVGMLVAGAGGLWLADYWGGDHYDYAVWANVYRVMALMMLVGIATTLIIREPYRKPADTAFRNTSDYLRFLLLFLFSVTAFGLAFVVSSGAGQWVKLSLINDFGMMGRLAGFLVEALRLALAIFFSAMTALVLVRVDLVSRAHVRETYVEPVADFFRRYGHSAIIVIALIGTYRIADIVMGVIANVFYLDMGFTKTQIAMYSKFWGLLATIGGGLLGGILSVRYGVNRTMFLGALLAAATNLLFAYLATQAPEAMLLLWVIVADNASAGLATAAFVAYLSSLTSISFTAMQYAIFSSVMTLVPKILAGYSGTVVDSAGYVVFFVGTAILGIPVLFLVIWAGRLSRRN